MPATPPPRMAWPLKGKILVPYGAAAGGQKNDGIDIQAEPGAPVKAAEGGTVVYVGSEVAHLGNLVLVQHPGGYITAYGNNEEVLVKKGEDGQEGRDHRQGRQLGRRVEPAAALRGETRRQPHHRSDDGAAAAIVIAGGAPLQWRVVLYSEEGSRHCGGVTPP